MTHQVRYSVKILGNKEKNEVTVHLKTGRFINIDSAVIISSVSEVVKFCIAVLTLLMMTAESMLSVLRFTMTLFFLLKLFSSHIHGIRVPIM